MTKIEEWEELCPVCKGVGFIHTGDMDKENWEIKIGCECCKETGKIDWVDKIKRKEWINFWKSINDIKLKEEIKK